ncbi:MAG: hypothetical protein ACP5NP_15015, partial [Acetobacteraceae bacterium]
MAGLRGGGLWRAGRRCKGAGRASGRGQGDDASHEARQGARRARTRHPVHSAIPGRRRVAAGAAGPGEARARLLSRRPYPHKPAPARGGAVSAPPAAALTFCPGRPAAIREREHHLRDIAIFRHNLFRISEPFITLQAQQLRRYRPLYLGRLRYGAPPDGAEAFTLADRLSPRTLPAIAWQMLTRDPRPFARLLAGRRVALIHAHFGIEGVSAMPLARRLGVPLVTT